MDGYYPILELPKVVKGISTFHIDNDGIDDVVVWDKSYLLTTRKREWWVDMGKCFPVGEAEITAVSISDVNSDGKSDIAILLSIKMTMV